MSIKTESERLFEQYLNANGLSFAHEKPFEGKSKLIDYAVLINSVEWLFEVKQAEADKTFNPDGGCFDPHTSVGAKIEAGKKKFQEYNGFPCVLVLYNNGRHLAMFEDFQIVSGAMYGKVGLKLPFDPKTGFAVDAPKLAFLDGGKMMRPYWNEPENTRISAVVVLRKYNVAMNNFEADSQVWLKDKTLPEPQLGPGHTPLCVMVYENVYARIPFPRMLLTANSTYDLDCVTDTFSASTVGRALWEYA